MYKKINSIQSKPSLYSYGKSLNKTKKIKTAKTKGNLNS